MQRGVMLYMVIEKHRHGPGLVHYRPVAGSARKRGVSRRCR
jgi:hypothetical protein